MVKALILFVLAHCQIESVQRWNCDRRGGIARWHYDIDYTEFAGQSFGGRFEEELVCDWASHD